MLGIRVTIITHRLQLHKNQEKNQNNLGHHLTKFLSKVKVKFVQTKIRNTLNQNSIVTTFKVILLLTLTDYKYLQTISIKIQNILSMRFSITT